MSKELITKLRDTASKGISVWGDLQIEAAEAIEALQARADNLEQQAKIHAQEARTANATIAEIYQLCTGATGEPGNWHGAGPVRKVIAEHDTLAAEQQAARAQEPVTSVVRTGLTVDGRDFADFRFVVAKKGDKCPKELYAAPVPPVREPFDVTLDETQATLLRDWLGDDKDEAASIRLLIGPGHSGYGLYVAQAEYQDEGAILLCSIPEHVEPSSINAKGSAS